MYETTWKAGTELLKGSVDPTCCDTARAYFGPTLNDGFWEEGELFNPIIIEKPKIDIRTRSTTKMVQVSGDLTELVTSVYGEPRTKVSEAVEYFLKTAHTGIPGNWINSLSRAVFSLSLSGVDESVIMDLCEKLAPQELDEKDLYQIEKGIADGMRERKSQV